MARLLINYRNLTNEDGSHDWTQEDLLTGFPFLDEQSDNVVENDYENVIEIDLGERTDTSIAQEQWLDTNPRIVGYSIETEDLHNER